jgi:L-serine dehydratase
MESISVFDIFKLGVGPSSSHTMGPWRAAQAFVEKLGEAGLSGRTASLRVDLYGSLAKTGKGHGTDLAVQMGLLGLDPETCDTASLPGVAAALAASRRLSLAGGNSAAFDPATDIAFHREAALPFHPNGLRFTATLDDGSTRAETYYSVGGGFIQQEGVAARGGAAKALPCPIESAADLLRHCRESGLSVPEVVRRNERAWRSDTEIDAGLRRIWEAMRDCAWRGCRAHGVLPGGLNVVRRAADLSRKLLGGPVPDSPADWLGAVSAHGGGFQETLKWVSCFALAVNEENAAFGRVVTAPTNGAAGVIPAVLLYYACFARPRTTGGPPAGFDSGIADFLLTAGEFGSIFKKGATLSAAMGGCQAEIGVSSAMAAAGLARVLGGTAAQIAMAAEIAMEHHLGLTCDPVGGLVQVPCIERNTMGAVKAITACNLALEGDPGKAKVSLDAVIKTLWETALDMSTKYKETSEGGLANQIAVNVSEC